MKRLFLFALVATMGLATIASCKCSSNSTKEKSSPEPAAEEVVVLSEENTTIANWATKIARDDSSITLFYAKNERQFYVHDELSNAQGAYYDKISPVAVTMQPDGRYFISYQNGMKDCYYINPETGLMDWRCEGYNPEIVKAKSFNAKLFQLALDDKE